jgi:Mg/Co/Ni transporter MgtE
MRKQISGIFAMAGLMLGLTVTPAFSQASSNKEMSRKRMSGNMSHKDDMAMMDKVSADEKAAMFDDMSEKDRMAAMKNAGHDMNKMSSQEQMVMKDKMTAQDKAAMFDKMPKKKRMAMMHKHAGMQSDSSKMDKMQKK